MGTVRRPGYYKVDFRPGKRFDEGMLEDVRLDAFAEQFYSMSDEKPKLGHRSGREFRHYFSRRPYYRYSRYPGTTTFTTETVVVNDVERHIPIIYVSTNYELAEINTRLILMEGRAPVRTGVEAVGDVVFCSITQNLSFPIKSKWDLLYLAQPVSRLYSIITTGLQWCTDYASALLWQPAYYFADKTKASTGLEKGIFAAATVIIGGPCWLISQTLSVVGDALASSRLALHAIVNLIPAIVTLDWERIKFCAREFVVNSLKLAPIVVACTLGLAPIVGLIKGGLSALWVVAAAPVQRFFAGTIDSLSKLIRRKLWPNELSKELLADHGKSGIPREVRDSISDSLPSETKPLLSSSHSVSHSRVTASLALKQSAESSKASANNTPPMDYEGSTFAIDEEAQRRLFKGVFSDLNSDSMLSESPLKKPAHRRSLSN